MKDKIEKLTTMTIDYMMTGNPDFSKIQNDLNYIESQLGLIIESRGILDWEWPKGSFLDRLKLVDMVVEKLNL